MQLFSMKSKLASPLHKPFERFFFFCKGLLPHSGPQVTMAMKTKKERFHVGALNRDLEGEMSREEEEEEEGNTPQPYKPYGWRHKKKKKSTEGGKNMRHRMREVNPRQVSGRVQLLYSPFWSPARVCFAPKPSPRRLVLRMLQTQTP